MPRIVHMRRAFAHPSARPPPSTLGCFLFDYSPTPPSPLPVALLCFALLLYGLVDSFLLCHSQFVFHPRQPVLQNLIPPKELDVQVRVMQDAGELDTEAGEVISLTQGSEHLLRRADAEQLIRQGVLRHVD